MKANELSIGDWVCYSIPNSYYCKVLGIRPSADGDPNNYAIVAQRDEKDPLLDYVMDCELFSTEIIHPIPLTKEILEKNGFKKCHEEGWSLLKYKDDDNKKKALYQIYWYKEKPFLKTASYVSDFGKFSRLGIKYVHELQHALRLCNIDKTIEL